jgi:hypothetical protein
LRLVQSVIERLADTVDPGSHIRGSFRAFLDCPSGLPFWIATEEASVRGD